MTKLTEGQNYLLGIIAAFIESILLQPTLYWKNAKAQGLPFTLNIRLIYRGTSASIINECQMMGSQFAITAFIGNALLNRQMASKDSRLHEMSSAGISGIVSAVLTSPIELVMIQQQRHGNSFWGTLNRIHSTYHLNMKGWMMNGLMRGYLGTALRDSIYVIGMLGVTPICQNHLITTYQCSSEASSIYASITGGIIAAVPSHPFDVVKTCMQGDLQQTNYKSFQETFRNLLNSPKNAWGVPIRLFSGCGWRTVNIVATVYIANESRNKLSKYFSLIPI